MSLLKNLKATLVIAQTIIDELNDEGIDIMIDTTGPNGSMIISAIDIDRVLMAESISGITPVKRRPRPVKKIPTPKKVKPSKG